MFKKIVIKLSLLGVILFIPFCFFAQPSNLSGDIRIAFLSDIHLKSDSDLNNVMQTIEHARMQQIDALLIGGDLVDNGNLYPEQWELVEKLINNYKDSLAIYYVPGNHDSDWHGTLPGLSPSSPLVNEHPLLYRDMNVDMIAKFKQHTLLDAIQTFTIKNAAFFLFYDYGYFSEISNVSKPELDALLPALRQFFATHENSTEIDNIIIMVHSPLADLIDYNIGTTIFELTSKYNKNVLVLSGHIHRNKIVNSKPLNIIVAPDSYRVIEMGDSLLKTSIFVNRIKQDSCMVINLKSGNNITDDIEEDVKITFDKSAQMLYISQLADNIDIYTLDGRKILSTFGDDIDVSTLMNRGILLIKIYIRNKLYKFKIFI